MATNPIPQAPWGEYIPHVGRMTIEQFEQFPIEEGWIYELHQGRILVMPGPGEEHGDIQLRLGLILGNYLAAHHLGEMRGTSCYILTLPDASEDLLCPDLSYIVPARRASMKRQGPYTVGAPDLVIEIASPNDTHPEAATKTAIYLRAGVQLVWNIWPNTKTSLLNCAKKLPPFAPVCNWKPD